MRAEEIIHLSKPELPALQKIGKTLVGKHSHVQVPFLACACHQAC